MAIESEDNQRDLEEVEETEKIGLKEEDALNRARWRDEVQAIAEGMR